MRRDEPRRTANSPRNVQDCTSVSLQTVAARDVEGATLTHGRISPDYSNHLSDVPCPLPRRIERVLVSISSPLMQPSPNGRRVGIRIGTFEAFSGFTHVTAHRIAQSPTA